MKSAPESDRWYPVSRSTGHQEPESGSEEKDAEGRSAAAQIFAAGAGEAAHDQSLQAARAASNTDQPLALNARSPALGGDVLGR